MKLVDSHCHLQHIDLAAYEGDVRNVVNEAKVQGIEHLLCVAIDANSYQELTQIIDLCGPEVSMSVGVHPNEPPENDLSLEDLLQQATDPRVIAIGETGLDYYRSEGDTTWQQERLRRHIQAAKQLKKPLIIHTRQAAEDTIRILKEEGAQEIGGVFHCFTESLEVAEQAMELGFYISISGIVTFANAVALQEVAKKIPLDRLLIETDAPFLAPVPYRGKPNKPAFVYYVAKQIAELRGTSLEAIAEVTTANFYRLFAKQPSV